MDFNGPNVGKYAVPMEYLGLASTFIWRPPGGLNGTCCDRSNARLPPTLGFVHFEQRKITISNLLFVFTWLFTKSGDFVGWLLTKLSHQRPQQVLQLIIPIAGVRFLAAPDKQKMQDEVAQHVPLIPT